MYEGMKYPTGIRREELAVAPSPAQRQKRNLPATTSSFRFSTSFRVVNPWFTRKSMAAGATHKMANIFLTKFWNAGKVFLPKFWPAGRFFFSFTSQFFHPVSVSSKTKLFFPFLEDLSHASGLSKRVLKIISTVREKGNNSNEDGLRFRANNEESGKGKRGKGSKILRQSARLSHFLIIVIEEILTNSVVWHRLVNRQNLGKIKIRKAQS